MRRLEWILQLHVRPAWSSIDCHTGLFEGQAYSYALQLSGRPWQLPAAREYWLILIIDSQEATDVAKVIVQEKMIS